MKNVPQDSYLTLIQLLSGMVENFLTTSIRHKSGSPSADTLVYLHRVILEEDYRWADRQLTAELLGSNHFVVVASGEAA